MTVRVLPLDTGSGGGAAERFEALSELLRRQRHLWEPRPFTQLRVAWEEDHPDVSAWLQGLDSARIDALDADDGSLPGDAPATLRRWHGRARDLSAIGELTRVDPPALRDHRLRWRVPGRKWAQVRAFAGAVLAALPGQTRRIVDWCAGKGHLGRSVGAAAGLPVTLIERSPRLCELGAELAARAGADCAFVASDVFALPAHDAIERDAAVIGLHACGNLTDELLRRAVDREARAIFVAPCCYHAIGDADHFTPRSSVGRAAGIPLERRQLRLATADETVARRSRREARRRELAWRLGLDLLLREASGEDRYLPLGPLRPDLLRLSFAHFCERAAERLELVLPPRWDPERTELAGHERARQARALSLVRGFYRRPFELWLVLDRALYLADRGRAARLGTFARRDVTARNLLLASVEG